MSDVRYSVVVPVWDERDNLDALADALVTTMRQLGEAFEVIAVDDGSTDGSADALDAIALREPQLRPLHLSAHCGQSAALHAGFCHARGDVVITIDADLQSDPADIPRLLARLADADAVVGIRAPRCDSTWKRLTSRLANGVRNVLTRDDVSDTGCPLKVFRTEAIRALRMWTGAHRFLPTLLRIEGFRVVEVQVSHRPRPSGRSKYGTWDRALAGLRDALGVRWLKDRRPDWRLRE